MKLVKRYMSALDANTAKFVLESEGIVSFLWDENNAVLGSFNSLSIGGVQLMVADEDLERAVEILARSTPVQEEPDENE